MKARIASIAVLFAALAASATAQIREGTVEINPYAGYLFGGNFGDATVDFTPFRLEVDDDAIYGGRVGFNITSHFEIEFEYGYDKTQLIRDNDVSFAPNEVIGDLTLQYYMGYATFNFGHGRLVPYFTIGSGAANLKPQISGVQTVSDTRYTGAIGGGIKYFFDPHFALRFDGRAYSTYLGDSTVLCGPYSFCTVSNWLTNGGFNGGFIVAF
jgi:hypothetical protein